MEEKADTMYYISMVDTAVLGVLGGICIVVGVVGAFFTAGATLPIAGVGCVLGGAVISSHSYTKTLDSDRSAGRDRSWSQFYLERTVKEFQGAAAGAVVFAGLLAGADLIAAAGGISSSIPSIVTAGTSGGTMAGALEAAGLEEAEDEKFILYFSKWIWAWIRNNVDKSFEEKPLWYHTLQAVTNSDSEAIELFFKLCDEFFQLDEEELQSIIDAADELDDEDNEVF